MAGMKLALLVAFVAMAITCVAARSDEDSNIVTIRYREYYNKDAAESKVFGPAPTENSHRNFGKGVVYDYKVTQENRQDQEERSRDQQEVGRSRGLYIENSIDGNGGQELFTVTFEEGELRGNSLTFGGHWSDKSSRNELAVTGGTGIFRFATGSAQYEDIEGQYYEAQVSLRGVDKKQPRLARF